MNPQERFWAKVDKSGPLASNALGQCWNWTASCRPNRGGPRGQFFVNGKNRYAYHVSYEWCVGPIKDGQVIDHKCHNGLCVNPSHLRAVEGQKQNLQNRRGANRNSKSGHRGVYYLKREGLWCASVNAGQQRLRRYFPSMEEAVCAAELMRDEQFTHHR